MDKDNQNVCCICHKPIEGYGNNPFPVCDDGVCCDKCNIEIVIPKRMENLVDGVLLS